ncbi:hypothetical protein PG996_000203 [Apiospora saccharicola]|uniref:Uncharacterized protein n=1 Tax=Apiospora saccharicola TaxID=335842 RepID=A0ABR1WD30_9PEZI
MGKCGLAPGRAQSVIGHPPTIWLELGLRTILLMNWGYTETAQTESCFASRRSKPRLCDRRHHGLDYGGRCSVGILRGLHVGVARVDGLVGAAAAWRHLVGDPRGTLPPRLATVTPQGVCRIWGTWLARCWPWCESVILVPGGRDPVGDLAWVKEGRQASSGLSFKYVNGLHHARASSRRYSGASLSVVESVIDSGSSKLAQNVEHGDAQCLPIHRRRKWLRSLMGLIPGIRAALRIRTCPPARSRAVRIGEGFHLAVPGREGSIERATSHSRLAGLLPPCAVGGSSPTVYRFGI